MSKRKFEEILSRWRVKAGFIGLILTIILAKPNLLSLLGGSGVCLLGLTLRTWATGHLRKEKELIISGPYQYTRNPLYLANLVIGVSTVVASRSYWMLGIFITYFLVFYPVVIKREKERMRNLFPREYEEYEKKAPLFFPSLKRPYSLKNTKFSWKLYRKNKEWKALLGATLFWLSLTIKMIVL